MHTLHYALKRSCLFIITLLISSLENLVASNYKMQYSNSFNDQSRFIGKYFINSVKKQPYEIAFYINAQGQAVSCHASHFYYALQREYNTTPLREKSSYLHLLLVHGYISEKVPRKIVSDKKITKPQYKHDHNKKSCFYSSQQLEKQSSALQGKTIEKSLSLQKPTIACEQNIYITSILQDLNDSADDLTIMQAHLDLQKTVTSFQISPVSTLQGRVVNDTDIDGDFTNPSSVPLAQRSTKFIPNLRARTPICNPHGCIAKPLPSTKNL